MLIVFVVPSFAQAATVVDPNTTTYGGLTPTGSVPYDMSGASSGVKKPVSAKTSPTPSKPTQTSSGAFVIPTGQALLDYFNPDKNPILKTADLKYIASSYPTRAPNDVPNYGKLCKIYGKDGGTATACLQPDGSFTLYAANGTPTDLRPAVNASNTNNPEQVAISPTGNTSELAPAVQGVPEKDESCSLGKGDLKSCLGSIMFWIIKKIGFAFLFLAATFAGIAGLLLNWVVYITVFQFGNLIGNNPGLLAAWGVLRDIGNLILLFGFIFMGISTILNLPNNEFTARRALPGLIIFAILMNFSLFAAEAVIDTSNAIGTTLYTQATQAGKRTCPEGEDFKKCATNYGISGAIFEVSGISGIFAWKGDKEKEILGNDLAAVIEILGLTVFAAVAAFVFFAAVFLFIARCVMLAFLMVTSPIGFAGMAIPPLHEIASQWWGQLLKQSFFAPIYILLILVSLKFMEGITVALNSASGGGDVSNLAAAFNTSGASNVSMIVNFILIIGFMLGSLQMAKSLGAFGADRATKFAGAATFGTAGFVGRRTVGAASTGMARAIRSGRFGAKFAESNLGRHVAGLADKGSRASFDVRTNKLVAGLGKAGKIELGAPSKAAAGGYHALEEEEVKKREEYAKSLKGRDESTREMSERIEKENSDIVEKRAAAEAAVTSALATETAATTAQATQKTRRDNAARSLAEQKARVALNPGDAAAQVALAEMEQQLVRETQELAQADQKLAEATSTLAQARTEEAAAIAARADTTRKAVSGKQQKENYAKSIVNESAIPFVSQKHLGRFRLTTSLTSQANHEASAEIIRNAGKSIVENALDTLKEEMGKKDAGDGHSTTPVSAPAAGGGGGH